MASNNLLNVHQETELHLRTLEKSISEVKKRERGCMANLRCQVRDKELPNGQQ